MKSHRFKYEYRKNASKLHKRVGDHIRASKTFGGYQIYQEYPVSKVNSNYSNNSHHFDWVIPTIKLVIECHGIQHEQPVAFDGNIDNSIDNFHAIQARDLAKKNAALAADYHYIVIRHDEIQLLTDKLLFDKIKEADIELTNYRLCYYEDINELPDTCNEFKKSSKLYKESDYYKKQLSRAREYRKQKYRRLKELKDGY